MTSGSQLNPALIAEGYTVQQENYCNIAAAAVLAYEIILTWGQETEFIWRRNLTSTTAIYLSMRYNTLLSVVLVFIADIMPGLLLPCQIIGYSFYAIDPIVSLSFAAFSSLRIWAIWDRNRMLLITTFPVIFVPAALHIWQYSSVRISASPLPVPFGGCMGISTLPITTLEKASTVGRACSIVADMIVLIATWTKTWSIRKDLNACNVTYGQRGPSISSLLRRDGTLYFLVLLCLNIAHLVLNFTSNIDFNPTAPFINSLTSILLCRLVLNLRSFNQGTNTRSDLAYEIGGISSVQFAGGAHGSLDSVSLGDIGSEEE